ncbi:MAG: FG-GAP repeat protein, partial [Rhodothermia bacterium]|nr:FG-GAP repeat protein [Rhodothermia bacterium]
MKQFCFALLAMILVSASSAQTAPGGSALGRDQIGFGSAAAIAGDQILISEPANDYTSGFVYVYEREGDEWKQVTRLGAPDGEWSDNFGVALDVDGGTLAVGATSQRDGQGAIYIFERDAQAEWKYSTTLFAGAQSLKLGRSIDLSGDLLLAGSAGDARGPGAAYVFSRGMDGAWAKSAVLVADSAKQWTGYASRVSWVGDRAVVAAPQQESGLAYVFKYDEETDSWVEEDGVYAADGESGDAFGTSMASRGNFLLVGAAGADRRTGRVYLFEMNPSTGSWTQVSRLIPFDSPTRASFGSAVGFRRGELWVGAPLSALYRGSIYMYEHDGEQFTSARKLLMPDADRGDLFGGSFAVAEDLAVVGIRGADFGFGNAAV